MAEESNKNLALYRKYRPRTFEEVVGQEHITKTLANQILAGKLSHAYLFTGSRGTGKTSVAKIFAKAVNCENNVTGSPCGECETCKRLAAENDINIVEIDAASNNRVDDIRELREKVKFAPIGAKYKVYIIDEVHMLSDSAFNALLKTLEEPPKYVIFILATTEVQKLPATILSRCSRFDFRLLSVENLCKVLFGVFEKEGIDAEPEAVKLIAAAGEGSVRDTLSIADSINAYASGHITKEDVLKVLGTTDHELLITFFDKIIDKDIGGVLEEINKIDASGKNLAIFAKDAAKHARDLLICKTCSEPNEILNLPDEIAEKFIAQSERATDKQLIGYMQNFAASEADLRYALSTRLLLENVAISCISGDFQKKKLIKPPAASASSDVREIWGKVVLFLKEHKHVALHVACGDITDVKIDGSSLVISTTDTTVAALLNDGKRDIERALSWQGLEMNVEINKKEILPSKVELDRQKLEKMFGEKFKVID